VAASGTRCAISSARRSCPCPALSSDRLPTTRVFLIYFLPPSDPPAQPVFQVKTLDGRAVWRDRLYRVRRAAVPGSFHLSVLDNGVVSSEFWRVLDVDEDLGWGAFYYSGAASKAGLSYTGAILTSRDGLWPEGTAARARIVAALERAGILPWELSNVTHDASAFGAPMAPAPVALPGTGVLAAA
jgi:hypothetical protein